MDLKKSQYIGAVASIGVMLVSIPSANLRAEFVLDWTADNASPEFSGSSIVHGGTTITGQTPFVYERTGSYYHLIVGDPAQDFAQEVYIRLGGVSFQGGVGNIRQGSASGGTGGLSGNNLDPLGAVNTSEFTGNGTGNPNKIQMREIHKDGDFSMDFTKNLYLEKPTMSLGINSADFQTQFVIDNSGVNYEDDATTAIVTNTVQLLDPDIPAGAGSFDMSTDVQDSFVSAGRYTYIAGPGTGASGTYIYPVDTFNMDNINWVDYFDSGLANPWGYTDNRP